MSSRLSPNRKLSPIGACLAESILLGTCILNLLFLAGSFLWNNPFLTLGILLNFQMVLGLGIRSTLLTAGTSATVRCLEEVLLGCCFQRLLHLDNGRCGGFCLIPGLLEPVSSAVRGDTM